MSMPFALPPWLPWWVPILVLVPAILYALLFLLMPFSVIGVKGRLDVIEARMDELQGEIRTLSLRLGEPTRNAYSPDEDAYDTSPLPAARSTGGALPMSRPPVPPAPDPYMYDDPPEPRPVRVVRSVRGAREEQPRPSRAEPRFD
jgi:hypothetical protein